MSDAPTPAPDPRPRPQYGEYAPPGYVPPSELRSESPVEPAPTPVASHRMPSWDRTLTNVLLAVGLLGALIAWMVGSSFAESLPIALQQYGIEPGPMPQWLDAAGAALVASHLLLYLLAVGLTIALRRAGRPAFWAPLTAGVIAAIIFWSVMSAAIAPYAYQLQP